MPGDDLFLSGLIHLAIGEALADVHVGAAGLKVCALDLGVRGGEGAQAQQCYERNHKLSHSKLPNVSIVVCGIKDSTLRMGVTRPKNIRDVACYVSTLRVAMSEDVSCACLFAGPAMAATFSRTAIPRFGELAVRPNAGLGHG